MVNPSFPKNQMVGVFNLELARMYGYLYQTTDKNYAILHDLAGYDEISLTDRTKMITNREDKIIRPVDLGIKSITQSDIYGGKSVKESAEIFLKVLQGEGTEAQTNVVCANAGLAISVVNQSSHQEGFELAKESLLGKKALSTFKKLKEFNN